jgi:UDP-glucose 4-epimerase
MTILVTGGAGYIGSHATAALLDRGFNVVVLDDLSTGYRQAVDARATFYQGQIQDVSLLDKIFSEQTIEGVIHFAAKSLVGESMTKPLFYYHHNVYGTQVLLERMLAHDVKTMVFSSTAAVYGEPQYTPIDESHPAAPISPYGASKLTMESMMHWADRAHDLRYIALRYFNVAGAHHSGELGEAHNPETHLIPMVLQVPLGHRESLSLFGDDYPTPDGTCIRDYIHIDDLIEAHILALLALKEGTPSQVINLGTGHGASNLEILKSAEAVTNQSIAYVIAPRRLGDPAVLIASNERARDVLGWTPKSSTLDKIISSAWKFHSTHPMGYVSK